MIEGWHTDDFRCPYQYYFVNGKLNEGLNGYNGETWYVENGRVNFTKTGFVDFDGYGAYEYIQNGQHDSDFNGLVYAISNGICLRPSRVINANSLPYSFNSMSELP